MGRKRHDPPSRAADGFRALDALDPDTLDPDRWYVLTNPNDIETGTESYLTIPGACIELKRKDGPRLVVGDGVAEGQAVTRMGLVLVSYPKSEKLAQQAEVEARADAFDRRTLKDGNTEDPMRGRHGWGSNRVDPNETEWPQGAA